MGFQLPAPYSDAVIALRSRARFCATYVTLPFSLSPAVNKFGVLGRVW